ncbi:MULTISPECIES: hypothetical protein [unclassified Endozoicomonas]|uniref:hypothetical protein n=1 Tax=unclassified Endozoicomonas TaxID=2644528 RepID=UPI003BB5487F
MSVNVMTRPSWRCEKNHLLSGCILTLTALILPLSGLSLEILSDEVVEPASCLNQEPDFLSRLKHNQRYFLLCHVPAPDWKVFRDDIIDDESLKVEAEQLVEKISNNDYILPASGAENSEVKNDDAVLEKIFDLLVYIHIHLAGQLTTDNLLNAWITQLLPAAQFGSASISKLDSVSDGSFQGVQVNLDERYRKAFLKSATRVDRCPHGGSEKAAAVLTRLRILDRNSEPFIYDREKNLVQIPIMAKVWADIAEHNRLHFYHETFGQSPEKPVLFLGAPDIKALYKLRKNGLHPVTLYHPKLSEPSLTADDCYAGPAMSAWHGMSYIILLSTLSNDTKQHSYELYNSLTQLGQELQTGSPSSPGNAFFLAHYLEAMDRLSRTTDWNKDLAFLLRGLFKYKPFFEGESVNISDSTYFDILEIGHHNHAIGDERDDLMKLLSLMMNAKTELQEAYWGLAGHYYVFTHMDKWLGRGNSKELGLVPQTLVEVWRAVRQ